MVLSYRGIPDRNLVQRDLESRHITVATTIYAVTLNGFLSTNLTHKTDTQFEHHLD